MYNINFNGIFLNPQFQPSQSSRIVCKHFVSGYCRKGSECKNIHDKNEPLQPSKPSQPIESSPNHSRDDFKVFVGRLASKTTDHSLRLALSKFGVVKKAQVHQAIHTTVQGFYGIVMFDKIESVDKACSKDSELLIDNQIVDVKRIRTSLKYQSQQPSKPEPSQSKDEDDKKFVICKKFSAGFCEQGDKCEYIHVIPENDKRFKNTEESCDDDKEDNQEKIFVPHKICKYFTMGKCLRGNKCTFLHPVEKKPISEEQPMVLSTYILKTIENMRENSRKLALRDLNRRLNLPESLRLDEIRNVLTTMFPKINPYDAIPELAVAVIDAIDKYNKIERNFNYVGKSVEKLLSDY